MISMPTQKGLLQDKKAYRNETSTDLIHATATLSMVLQIVISLAIIGNP